MERHALIARKQEVRRLLEHAARELTRIDAQSPTWRTRRTVNSLQGKIERLMAEEYALRLAIDRAGKGE
ncbi:MAG: hypothetical protein R6W76_03720 [Caldilinea sp.]